MKLKWVKIIFFSIIILLIGISTYIIYGKEKKSNIIEDSKYKNNYVIKDISIGITGYDTINPLLSKNQDSQYISKLIYNSILTINKDFKLECDLAKEYSKLNNITYLIKLKENIFWHDGKKFTAKDVSFTIRNLKKINDSIYNKNVENIEEIEVIDDYTIKVYLNKNVENFEYLLYFPILAEHSYEEGSLISKENIPIGTGNYKIESSSDKSMILKNNENRKIKVLFYSSVTKLYNAFNKKDIDIIYSNNIDYEKYIGKIGYETNSSVGQKYSYLIINTKNVNKETRQAINYGINKKNIIYKIYNNKYFKADFPIDYKKYLYNDNIETYKNNSVKDFKKENNNIFRLLVDKENEKLCLVAEQIKEQLKEIGINVDIVMTSNLDVEYYINIKEYDFILKEEKIDIEKGLNEYLGENNISNYNNKEIESLLNEIKNVEDKKILEDKYKEILRIYSQDLPFISLYFSSNFILYNSNLRGDFEHNWFNLFYNIDNWYKIENKK